MQTPRGAGPRRRECHQARLSRTFWASALLILLAVAGFAPAASAQSLIAGSPVDFGGIDLGSSTSQTLSYSVPPASVVTFGTITTLTEGTPGKDFAAFSPNCTGTHGGPYTCQVTVTFAPLALGLRPGELFIYDGSNNVIVRVPLRGVGTGPQVVLSPATAVATTSLSGIAPATINPSSTVYDGSGNLYIDDALNGRILESVTAGSATVAATLTASNASAPFSSIAIGGDGTLYISSPNTGTIYSIPPGGTIAPLVISGVTLLEPAGLALDGFGNLYVADAVGNDIVRIALENGNQASVLPLSGLGTPLSGPEGLSIDDADNLYVADTSNNRIVKIDLQLTSSPPYTNVATALTTPGLTLSGPESVAVNAGGGLTIADTGNQRLVDLPLSGAPYALILTGATLSKPAGVTLLPTGDLLVSDTVGGLVQITRSASSLTFATPTLVGSIDAADGDLALNVENTGTYPLQVPGSNFPNISNNAFFADTTGTCPNTINGTNGTQIPAGAACTLEIGFKPTANGLNTGNLAITATGGIGSVSATVALTGTGYVVLDHFIVTVTPSTVTPGEATTLTVTAINNDGSLDTTYTGTINLSCTDPACVLPGGSYTFTAGDSGTHVFPSTGPNPLNFNTLGTWTVSVADTTFTSGQTYTGTSNTVTVITTPAVTLASTVNPVNVGDSTTLTATVSSPFGTPTGTVTFLDGSTVLGTGTLNSSGVATLTVSFATSGQHPLTVSYPGAGFFQAATSSILIENVQTLATTVGLTSSVNPVNVNANTVLTATVASTTGTPTGSVTFLDGATVLGTAALNASGIATLTVSFSTPGTHPLTASYPGVGAFQPGVSSILNESVQNFTPTITLTSSVNPVLVSSPTVFTATLASGAGTPPGSVTFHDGAIVLGTATLNASGVATLSVTFSTTGAHTITAVYAGNGLFQAVTSAPLTETVEDFTLSLATGSATSATILLGGTTQFNLLVSPVGALNLAAPVTLSVSGLPAGASASFAPATVPTGAGPTPVVMTLNAPPIVSAALRLPARPPSPSSRRSNRTAPIFFALLLLPVGALARRRRSMMRLLVLVAGLAVTTGLSGCLSNDTTGYYGQTPETYTLIVSGSSGTLVHSVQVTLTLE